MCSVLQVVSYDVLNMGKGRFSPEFIKRLQARVTHAQAHGVMFLPSFAGTYSVIQKDTGKPDGFKVLLHRTESTDKCGEKNAEKMTLGYRASIPQEEPNLDP